MSDLKVPSAPVGFHTINPFIISDQASEVIAFVKDVFGGVELPETLTYDNDGLILHSEVKVGDSIVQIADRKPDWPFTPGLLQVYVDDIETTLEKARSHGATVITRPTEYLGIMFSRVKDAQNNLWWVWQNLGDFDWEATADTEQADDAWEPTPEAQYIYDTLLEAMRGLGKS